MNNGPSIISKSALNFLTRPPLRLCIVVLTLLAAVSASCADKPLISDAGRSATPAVSASAVSAPASPLGTANREAPARSRSRNLAPSIVSVQAAVETTPVDSTGDAADDMAIWVHPADPSLSTVIGTDKGGGGVIVYNLDGSILQAAGGGRINNVDLRNGFKLNGETVSLVVGSNRIDHTADVWAVDLQSRELTKIGATGNASAVPIYGACMYHSPETGRFYAIITADNIGTVQQFEIRDAGNGNVVMQLVRTLELSSQSEGCVADDVHARLYLAEEEKGIWRFGAEPDSGTEGVLIDDRSSGNFDPDVEGLTIYYAGETEGYLIASSQGNDTFVVYDRLSEAHIGAFRIADGVVDGVTGTDGIDVSNAALGPLFPNGVFVVQDDENRDAGSRGQNFKLVPWDLIATSFEPALTIDTRPRP